MCRCPLFVRPLRANAIRPLELRRALAQATQLAAITGRPTTTADGRTTVGWRAATAPQETCFFSAAIYLMCLEMCVGFAAIDRSTVCSNRINHLISTTAMAMAMAMAMRRARGCVVWAPGRQVGGGAPAPARPMTAAEILEDCGDEMDEELEELFRTNEASLRQLRSDVKKTKRQFDKRDKLSEEVGAHLASAAREQERVGRECARLRPGADGIETAARRGERSKGGKAAGGSGRGGPRSSSSSAEIALPRQLLNDGSSSRLVSSRLVWSGCIHYPPTAGRARA